MFNWALSRSLGGDFILRIDDTDAARSTDVLADEMQEAMRWLSLDWDEGPDVGGDVGPYVQSQRRPRHLEIAARLYGQGSAYYGNDANADRGPDAGAELRLHLPESGEAVVDDALRGPVRFHYEQMTDPVLVRSDGSPLFHLATVADDHDMAISHVVRGEEWLASTPIHVLLYQILGWRPPVWVHLPLILDRRGQKLSKRDGPGGYLVDDFQELGYLPDAVFNYLLLLGWSPPGEREFVDKADVRRYLRLEDLSASPAMFDWEKLNWLNRHYLQRRSDAQLAQLIRPYLEEAYQAGEMDDRWLARVVSLFRDEMSRLSEAVPLVEWALSETFDFSPEAAEALEWESAHPVLVRLVAELAHVVLLDEQTAESILQNLRGQFAEMQGWTAREVYWPIRAALTGRVRGPALHHVMALLGKGRCLERAAVILRGGQ